MYNINELSWTSNENPEWFARAMFGGRLVQGGYIRVLTGIKGDELLSQIDLENKILQIDGKDCAWTPNQIIKLSEKKASVKTYKINLEECIDTLENKRTVYQLSAGAQNDSLPPELEAATLQLIAIGLSNEIEEMIIGGDSAVDPNQFDGMVKTLLNSTEAIKLVGTTITKANVMDAIEAAYNAVPEDVLQAEDAGNLYAFVSYGTRRKLRNALTTVDSQRIAQNFTLGDSDPKNPVIYYLGMEIVPVKGIGENDIIVIDGNNALLLTDMMSDLEEIELGQFPKPHENKVFIKGRMRLGFTIPFESEAVIWSDKITVAQAANPYPNDLIVLPNSLVFSAAGESKTFKVVTVDEAAEIELSANPDHYTVTKGATADGVTTVTVVATANTGNTGPRVGQVVVKVTGTNRSATVMLDTHMEDVINVEG